MEKKNKKPILFLLLIAVVGIVVGGTLAYFTTTDTYTNIFNTGSYDIEMIETFVSPDNWTPGTTTPKTIIATNHGTTPAAVRVKLTPSWEDKKGDPLPLTDGTNEAAIINFNSNLNRKWVYQDGYYYYKRALNENQSTTTLLNSVTFNPEVTFDKTRDCDTVNGVTTCTTTFNDYAGGKYTLKIDVETAQFDKYQEIWGTSVDLKEPILVEGTLMVHNDNQGTTFGKNIARANFESLTIVDNIDIPETAIDSWDVSAEQNGSVMAWYLNENNNTFFELYIGQEDGVIANPNSSYALSYFRYLKTMDVTNLDVSNVTDMSYMLTYDGRESQTFSIQGLEDWDTSNVTNMTQMISVVGYSATTWSIGNLSNWDTSNVTNMSYMFNYAGLQATTFNIGNLNNWKTSNVADMQHMFDYAGYNATTWNIGNISDWNVSNVTNLSYFLSGTGGNSTVWSVGDLSDWNVSNVTDMSSMFSHSGKNAGTWFVGNLGKWDVSNVQDMSYMFMESGYNSTNWSVGDLSSWDTSKVYNMTNMFDNAGTHSITWGIGDLSNWDTSKATSTLLQMFASAGRYSTTWNSIGTLKVYAHDLTNMFIYNENAKAVLEIRVKPTAYTNIFLKSATNQGSGITVNYTSAVTNIDNIIATKSSNSNVVKGSVVN